MTKEEIQDQVKKIASRKEGWVNRCSREQVNRCRGKKVMYPKYEEQAITVRMVNMDWFYKDNMLFIHFAKLMLIKKPDELYSSDFVKFTLNEFWKTV